MLPGMNGRTPDSSDNVSKELRVHGGKWATAHGSYFSDPVKAGALLDKAVRIALRERPNVIADIGGGTGFLLDLFRSRMNGWCPRLVDVDVSPEQLQVCASRGLEPMLCSVLDVRRGDLVNDEERLMLISRSVMHYFGRNGQDDFLRALRSVMRKGEYLVQQPACFTTPEEVGCMNELYPIMGVDKFYLDPEDLQQAHERNGFEVMEMSLAPSLDLRSTDLAERYALGEPELERMCETLRRFGLGQRYEVRERHFRGPFTYRIVVARAI